jgi:Sec-independent protein translocase protein TatA
MNPIPSPETLSGYERLGIIGILLLMLAVGLVVIGWAVRRFSRLASQAFDFVQQQTHALTSLRDSHEKQQETQERLHARLDALMSCTRSGCSVFEMRKKQHKDAARTSEENPVSATPPHPAT